jgi:hypothetical protein
MPESHLLSFLYQKNVSFAFKFFYLFIVFYSFCLLFGSCSVDCQGCGIVLAPMTPVLGQKTYELIADSEAEAQIWFEKLLPSTVNRATLLHRPSFWQEVRLSFFFVY